MTKTAVALYDEAMHANAALADLRDANLDRNGISRVGRADLIAEIDDAGSTRAGASDMGSGAAGPGTATNPDLPAGAGMMGFGSGIGDPMAAGPDDRRRYDMPGIGTVDVGGPIGDRLGDHGLVECLSDLGVPGDDADAYAEGVRRGGTLLVLQTDDEDAARAVEILDRHDPVHIDDRRDTWREAGWARFDATAPALDQSAIEADRRRRSEPSGDLGMAADKMRTAAAGTERTRTGEEAVIPVTEEELRVGKHAVERGRVRVHTHVTERPVEAQVKLRDEHIDVERRPASGTTTARGADFQERTVEVTETDEVPDIAKRARVTEEVVVRKDADTRTETVRDTVRKTDVDIDDGRSGGRKR